MKWITNLKRRIDSWRQYHDPYYWWWKAKEKYPPPKAKFFCGRFHGYFGLPCRLDSYKGIQFFSEGLGWKTKYSMVRHEWNPIICLMFTTPWKYTMNNKFGNCKYKKTFWIGWTFIYNQEDYCSSTWEEMLEYIFKKEDNESKNN